MTTKTQVGARKAWWQVIRLVYSTITCTDSYHLFTIALLKQFPEFLTVSPPSCIRISVWRL